MKLNLLLTIICAVFLSACGGTNYSGTMKRQVGPEQTEQKAIATLKKESEKIVEVKISDADSNNATFLSKCPSLKFIKQEGAKEVIWMSTEQPCSLFKENDSKFSGMLTFDEQKLRLSGTLSEYSRSYFHEFEGTAK